MTEPNDVFVKQLEEMVRVYAIRVTNRTTTTANVSPECVLHWKILKQYTAQIKQNYAQIRKHGQSFPATNTIAVFT